MEENKVENAKNGVHDPTIIQEGSSYYLFSTDTQEPPTRGVPIRISKDLIHWEFAGTALDGVPDEAKSWSNASELWAPEIIKYGEEFRMYYSASTFGSTTSFIGLATAPHPLGPWKDQGEVVKTRQDIAEHNAIDANVCQDREGTQWLVYGSFFGGIHIARLDSQTGKFAEEGYGRLLAIRPQTVEGAIEGPFILYNEENDSFYLFVSFDSLNDTYNIRVGRSKEIDGPYFDFNGYSLLDLENDPAKIGTKLLGSYHFSSEEAHFGPGHNSIFKPSHTSQEFMIHHVRRVPHTSDFFLGIRRLFWLSNGWPVVSACFYAGEVEMTLPEDALMGEWEWLLWENGSQLVEGQTEAPLTLEKLQKMGKYYTSDEGELLVYYEIFKGKPMLCASGMKSDGQTFLGRKTDN